MELIVSLIGSVIFGIGVFGALRPSEVVTLLTGASPNSLFNLAIGTRLVMGVIFIALAPATRFPTSVYALGGFVIILALILPILGRQRFQSIVAWGARRSPTALRLGSVGTAMLGAFLLYAGL
jgi:hypothetical protein